MKQEVDMREEMKQEGKGKVEEEVMGFGGLDKNTERGGREKSMYGILY